MDTNEEIEKKTSAEIDASTAREKLERAGSLHWFHWTIVLFSFVLTFTAWYFSKSQYEARIGQQFEREADHVVELVQERMQKYEEVLWGGVAMIDTYGVQVDFEHWEIYANSIDIGQRYPGISGIGVIQAISLDERDEYLADQRRSRSDFDIHPAHDETELYPISYVIPVKGNEKAVGLDMAHETNRYTAAKKSRDTGSAQITGPITLVQDTGKTPGFLFYAPSYMNRTRATIEERRSGFYGLVYAPFIVTELMAGTLNKENRHIGISLTDGDEVLYDEHVATVHDFDPDPIFSKTVDVNLYGRTWTFDIRSDASFRAASTDNQPLTILIGGITIDTMLILLFVFLSRGSHRALKYADSMTHQLEETNEELEQFAYIASHDLRSPLQGIKNLASWIHDDNVDLLPEDSKKHLDTLRSRVSRMEKLLEDLLNFSKAGRRSSDELVEVNLAEMLENTTDVLNLPEGFTVKIVGDFPTLVTDRTPLELVFRNLINNAIKHHDKEDGTVEISFKDNEAFYEFTVADDGPGIPEEFQNKIFDMFATLKSRDKSEGSGMGLAMVKKVLKSYGGGITPTSSGRGTKFDFTWPKDIVAG